MELGQAFECVAEVLLEELKRFQSHIDPGWIEEALEATGTATVAAAAVAGGAGRLDGAWDGLAAGRSDFQPVAPNLLGRRFEADVPNQRWVGDTTELRIRESGRLFLAVIVDLFSRFAVGWALSAVNDRHLAINALKMAARRRCPNEACSATRTRAAPTPARTTRRRSSYTGSSAA
jgi:transposase InsO family protein